MGSAATDCQWAVLTYRTAAGEWYCMDLDDPHLQQTVDWCPPNSNRPADLMAPVTQPTIRTTLQGKGKEVRRVANHQAAIDVTQRMLQGRRP